MSLANYPTMHIRATIRGASRKQALLHHILRDIDKDWPMHPDAPEMECTVCHGLEWKCPVISPSDIYRLAAQISSYSRMAGEVKFKLKTMLRETGCAEQWEASQKAEADAPAEASA